MHETALVRLDIKVSRARNRDDHLSLAVNQLIPAALERRHGILVTQVDSANYIIEVHPSVPCGTIQEKASGTHPKTA